MEEDDATKINGVSYTTLEKIPFDFKYGFYQSCQGRILIGGGDENLKVVELDGIDWMEDHPPLNVERWNAASVYHAAAKSLIVAGGSKGYFSM